MPALISIYFAIRNMLVVLKCKDSVLPPGRYPGVIMLLLRRLAKIVKKCVTPALPAAYATGGRVSSLLKAAIEETVIT